jgi:hypothetical protein
MPMAAGLIQNDLSTVHDTCLEGGDTLRGLASCVHIPPKACTCIDEAICMSMNQLSSCSGDEIVDGSTEFQNAPRSDHLSSLLPSENKFDKNHSTMDLPCAYEYVTAGPVGDQINFVYRTWKGETTKKSMETKM